jgi:hypothetical protein
VNAAYAAQRECQAEARSGKQERVATARQTVPGEADLPVILSWLGALGASTVVPLLMALIRAARKGGAS